MTHQPATCISISLQHPFNRAGEFNASHPPTGIPGEVKFTAQAVEDARVVRLRLR